MLRRTFIARSSITLGALMRIGGLAVPAQAAPDSRTQTVVTAARAFLNALSHDQQAAVLFAFARQPAATAAHFRGGFDGKMDFVGEQYGQAMWSNFPISDVPRPGLPYGNLNAAQRDALLRMLQVLLSPTGYRKVRTVMGSDQALAESGTKFAAGTDTYTLGIFGTPSTTTPWMVQFGGHHLALNITIMGERGVLAPVLIGAQPAVYTAGGRMVRVLADENDKAFALLHALDDGQRRQAVIEHRVSDLMLGPGHDGETMRPVGLKASLMTEPQQAMLLDLIAEWSCLINEAYAAPRMAEIRAGLRDTFFAWSGPETHAPDRNGASYFRIQGPKLVIEFSPQQPGGDLTMHVHTIYRDPSNAYGRTLT